MRPFRHLFRPGVHGDLRAPTHFHYTPNADPCRPGALTGRASPPSATLGKKSQRDFVPKPGVGRCIPHAPTYPGNHPHRNPEPCKGSVPRRPTSLHGFSLIEIMCAILILGIGLVGLTQGITVALSSAKESELQTSAALLAAGQIETLRAEGFIKEGETEGEGEGALSTYKWRQTISTTETDGLFAVTVEVENAQSGQLIYELKTMLFDPPLTEQDRDKLRKDKDKKKEGAKG